ncbi:MAG TPA: hypothetical protein VNW04_23480, partial [Puia sp.]|nr:hypothetical protein [Puia sp.]
MLKLMVAFALQLSVSVLSAQPKMQAREKTGKEMDLSGEWLFQIDPLDKGAAQQWWLAPLGDTIHLPGSMTTNGKGDEVTVGTKWTGNVWNNAWYTDTAYAKYRQAGNVKVSFWLQPVKHYVGPAWYQKKVTIDAGWKDHPAELFLERCHWETTLWIDNRKVGMQNALCAPDVFGLGVLTPGEHTITLRIDNRIKEIDPGADAHSVTDNTQTNWNGIIGKMILVKKPAVHFSHVQVFPDVDKKRVHVKIVVSNVSGREVTGSLSLSVKGMTTLSREVVLHEDTTSLEIDYPMGDHPLLWD